MDYFDYDDYKDDNEETQEEDVSEVESEYFDYTDVEEEQEEKEREPKVKEKVVKVTEVPDDYRRVVAFVGAPNVGTTSLSLMVADRVSSRGVKVALLDLTENRDLYEMFIFEKAYYRDDLKNPLEGLNDGKIEPVRIKKDLDLFTASYSKDIYYDLDTMFEALKLEYNIIICDMDLKTNLEAVRFASQIYVVQDMDWTNYKYVTSFQKNLDSGLNLRKVRYIINKYDKSMTQDIITDCMITDVDLDTMDKYNIMEEKPKTFIIGGDKNWRKAFNRNVLDFKVLRGKTKRQIKKLAYEVYPVKRRIF